MANEMKTRIVLEGEKEYARAMADAARQIKVLNAEERLAQAQFRATGNAEEHAAEQARILREQIAAQKTAVAAAEQAVRQLTEQGVQPNDTAMQKWRTKLVNARTALVQLQTRLDGVETDLKEDTTEFGNAQTAAGDYGQELQKIGGTINTQAAIDSIGKITDAISGAVQMAARLTKAVIGAASDAGKWADEVKTTADQMGIDPETLQSWQYAAMYIDTEMTDITKSWQDIGKKLLEGNNDYAVGLDNMGIATRDAAGNLRSTEDIFWDAIDYLHGIDDESIRAAKATELFGNDWRKINPLIQAGSAAFKELAAEGMDVAVVSNENVDALGTMQDSFDGLQARFMKLKLDTLSALAPTFERVAKALSTAVTALNEFIQSEEGQAALEALGGALESVINQFTGVDENGENKFKKLVDGAANSVQGLVKWLEWIRDNPGAITVSLGIIGGAFSVLMASKAVLTFIQLANSLPGVLSAITGASTTIGTNAGISAAGKALATGVSTGAGGMSTAGTMASMLAGAGQGLAYFAPVLAALGGSMLQTRIAVRGGASVDAEDIISKAEEMGETLAWGNEQVASLQQAYEAGFFDWGGRNQAKMTGAQFFAENWASMREATKDRDIWRTLAQELGMTFDELMAVTPDSAEFSRIDQSIKGMMLYTEALLDGVDTMDMPEGAIAWNSQGTAAETQLSHMMSDYIEQDAARVQVLYDAAGQEGAEGYVSGLKAHIGDAAAAGTELATATLDAIRAVLDIHSPSRVMAQLGVFTGKGYAEGIEKSTADVVRAVDGMMGVTRRTAAAGAGGIGGPGGYAAGNSYSSSFYIDKYYQQSTEDARALAARVQDVQGWTRAGFGHRA